MAWCEANKVRYILGLPTNKVLHRMVSEAAEDVCVRRAEAQQPVLRGYTEVRYGAKSWQCTRRVAARIEASALGLDIRYVVTNLADQVGKVPENSPLSATLTPTKISPKPRCNVG
jgi:hypothetical protein